MKRLLSASVFAAFLPYSQGLSAQEDWNFAGQFAIETRISELGAAAFADIEKGWIKQMSFGFGLYHPNEIRPTFRNTFGVISRSMFGNGRIAQTDEVEVVFIQPLPAIAADISSNRLLPYIGWGFSLTVLEIDNRSRGYSALVFETGIDLRRRESPKAAGVRASIHVLVSGEHITVGLFWGIILHPVPIAGEFIN
ncbi:MAG: hypothetical protein HYS76_01705 [Candidatus Wildermuthbacteria bacterium]|nr:hypothetical protein [Candidatus Wildermuthbacteria bacterium]